MGRGGGGGNGKGAKGGGGGGANTPMPVDDRSVVEDSADKHSDPAGAAQDLGLTGSDAEHFVHGADAAEKRIDRAGGPEAAVAAHKKAVDAYVRKYGRGAGYMYSRGAYWSLIRYIKTVLAVATTATQAGSAPVHAAVNTTVMAAYWMDRLMRGGSR